MPNIKDVARSAGVSVATVSRVLNSDPNVASETRSRVFDAVTRLDYRPSSLARGLRTAETHTVGVILPDVTNPFFAAVLRGIEEVAWERGRQILIGDTANDEARQAAYLRLLTDKRTDGVLALSARGDLTPLLDLGRRLPVVLACEYVDGDPLPSVAIDNVGAALEATSHLTDLGHTRIAYIGGPPGVILCRDRRRGWEQALRFVPAHRGRSPLMDRGDFTIDSGKAAAERLLSLPDHERPTAIFCANDEMAIGAMQAARAAGLRVPEDLSVVGFDDIAMSRVVYPTLTTVSQPMYDLGRTAMELLLDGGAPAPGRRVLPHRLMVRGSTGPFNHGRGA